MPADRTFSVAVLLFIKYLLYYIEGGIVLVEKMKFLSITGPKDDIDRVAEEYLSKYEIHLENALYELKSVKYLRPYLESNPYKKLYEKSEELLSQVDAGFLHSDKELKVEEASSIITELDNEINELREKRTEIYNKKEKLRTSIENIEPFKDLDFNFSEILNFKFIRFRFGRMPLEQYDQFENFVYNELNTLFCKCRTDSEYVWGVYFVPEIEVRKIDAVFSTMYFERFYLSDEYQGTLEEAYEQLSAKLKEADDEIKQYNSQITSLLEGHKEDLYLANKKLSKIYVSFDIRKMAACTREGVEVFYILCGWMSEKDAKAFEEEIQNDDMINCIIEDDNNNINSIPPTKLRNPRIIKPFEMFIRMYGLPAYNEMDPTFFVALTYSFIFGVMFGDVGQGLVLTIGGFLLYRYKKMELAGIISRAGVFSTFFGLMFGSVFGFEEILPALWMRPVSKMSTIPFIGKINTVFIITIAFGMALIIINMIFHIFNAARAKDSENTFFDANGLAGLVFYGSLAAVIVLYMSGRKLPAGIILVMLLLIPLVVIALKEPLTHILEKKKDIIPGGKVMFFVQTFFEMFETLLSYFSNTLSFVRIGAFAVSHAAMMEVVLMLAGAANGEGGEINFAVIIFGNILVMGMEGLIVGIQVLRLEYYELFSRFYKGTGREFVPFYNDEPLKNNIKNKKMK